MKLIYTLTLVVISFQIASSQEITDFESHNLKLDTFLNGSDGSGGFYEGSHFYHSNFYNGFWLGGWALSTMRDTTTPDFTNLYSAIPGGGHNSKTYAVGQNHSRIALNSVWEVMTSVYITNATYAYQSMKNGDQFAKKFGGESGDDPDFFKLTIYPFYEGEIDSSNFVEFYLADYRFEDNSLDYIIKDWTNIDFVSFENVPVDSFQFELSSSDVGQFGMNTPAYFCIDDMLTSLDLSTNELEKLSFFYGPNPTTDKVNIVLSNLQTETSIWKIFNVDGKLIKNSELVNDLSIDFSDLNSGTYFIQVSNSRGAVIRKIIKQ